ncbi:MAG: Tat pathway signal sequence domain protein [Alphaproteobacteria bacterium]|nr:Tat pathway signal sequence domain protein [Alphaproteobacteria bacterium]
MQVKYALAAALLLAPGLAGCASSGGRTAELPGGGPTDAERRAAERAADAPNMFERAFGVDNRPNAGPCPLMGVLSDSARMVEFQNPAEERYANIAFTGEVRGVSGLCRYVETNPIEMSMSIDFAFGRGPAAASDRKTYRYWVAVTRRGVAPIAKQWYDIDVRFPRGEPVMVAREEIDRIIIPRATEETSGENFEVLVGFELTPAQLQFNRDGKRFRVDAATTQRGQ